MVVDSTIVIYHIGIIYLQDLLQLNITAQTQLGNLMLSSTWRQPPALPLLNWLTLSSQSGWVVAAMLQSTKPTERWVCAGVRGDTHLPPF